MITGVAFCPQAPALVPDVGRGLDAELGPVRAACREAIRRVATAGTRIVVVGSGPSNASFGATSRGSFAGVGVGVDLVVPLGSDAALDGADGPIDLPPSLAVGAWLVRDALGPDTGATGYSVAAADGELPDLHGPDPTALIVLGDGSARRTEKAPGHFDVRAGEYDRRLASALARGVGDRLHDSLIDPRVWDGHGQFPVPATDVEADLLVTGHWVRESVAWLVESVEWDAELLYDGAPFGVGYVVAAWMLRSESVRG